MNIKYIKELSEKKVLSKWYLERGGADTLVEDLPEDKRDRCMPYKIYAIPKIDDLMVMITDYASEDKIGVKTEASMTLMGFMIYAVTVVIKSQDTVEKTFTSPFLDDALAEALIALKENKDILEQMHKDMEDITEAKG